MLWLLAAHGEKSGVCKAKHGGISKPALLCRDYRKFPMKSIESFFAINYKTGLTSWNDVNFLS